MKQKSLYLAIDGGGLTTDCVLVDEQGTVLARAQTVASNHNRVGFESAVATLHGVIKVAKERASLGEDARIAVAVFGLAGVDTAADHAAMRSALQDTAEELVVMNDTALLLGLLPQSQGVALVAGTGSNCLGMGQDGLTVKVGGHGPDFDEGGGWWLAHRALVEASRISDGRVLGRFGNQYMKSIFHAVEAAIDRMELEGLLEKHDLDARGNIGKFEDMYEILYRSGNEVKSELHRAIIPALFDAAEAGTPEAWRVVEAGAKELAHHVQAAATALDMPRVPLVVSGSLLVKRPMYRTILMDQLIRDGIQLTAPMVVAENPLDGALLLARNHVSPKTVNV